MYAESRLCAECRLSALFLFTQGLRTGLSGYRYREKKPGGEDSRCDDRDQSQGNQSVDVVSEDLNNKHACSKSQTCLVEELDYDR